MTKITRIAAADELVALTTTPPVFEALVRPPYDARQPPPVVGHVSPEDRARLTA